MRHLNILFVQETNWLDRNVIHQHHLAERLVQRGHHVQVIDYDILWPERKDRSIWQPRQVYPHTNKVIQGADLEVIRPATLQLPLLCHLSWTSNSLVELRRILNQERPDVVIGLTLTNSYLVARLLKREGVPYISMVLEPYTSMVPQKWTRPVARIVESSSLENSDQVIVFTPQMREYVTLMGACPEKISLIKTGVSLDKFHPELDGSSQREKFGISAGDWVLFFMGWLYDFSGMREIITEISKNPEILDGACLLIIGDGDIYSDLKTIITEHNLGNIVILTGRRPYSEIPYLLAAADVCLMPSIENETTREIVPMKIYEYLAAGKPVVATRLPGILAEFGNHSGILYADDPLDALNQSLSLRSQPSVVKHLSEIGRRTAEQNADWEKTTDRFEQLLLDLTANNGKHH